MICSVYKESYYTECVMYWSNDVHKKDVILLNINLPFKVIHKDEVRGGKRHHKMHAIFSQF